MLTHLGWILGFAELTLYEETNLGRTNEQDVWTYQTYEHIRSTWKNKTNDNLRLNSADLIFFVDLLIEKNSRWASYEQEQKIKLWTSRMWTYWKMSIKSTWWKRITNDKLRLNSAYQVFLVDLLKEKNSKWAEEHYINKKRTSNNE